MTENTSPDGLDLFERLRAANQARQERWPGAEKVDPLFRAVEFGEEAGELLGTLKKLTRGTRGIAGNGDVDVQQLRQRVREEIGDVLICLDLVSEAYGIDLRDCVPMKFNMTSRKVGVPVFMGDDWHWGVLPFDVAASSDA